MRSSRLVMLLFGLLVLGGFRLDAFAQAGATGFLDRTVTIAGEAYRSQVYVPADYTRSRTWPVVLFLHGGGERGTDGLVQTEVGIGRATPRVAARGSALA